MPRAGFEPAIPAIKRPHTYTLDRAATVIGRIKDYRCKLVFCFPILNFNKIEKVLIRLWTYVYIPTAF
jgi:hypothetical protein